VTCQYHRTSTDEHLGGCHGAGRTVVRNVAMTVMIVVGGHV
jgi:hypothetical protein